MGIFKYINQEHAEVFIFDDFIIKQVREGYVINKEHNDQLKSYLKTNFKDRKVAYISNRIVSYSVDPLIYKEAEKIPNLVAIAVIPGNQKMRDNAEFEKQFYNKPYGIFDNLTDAIAWVSTIIKKNNEKIMQEN